MTEFNRLGLKRTITGYQTGNNSFYPVQVIEGKPRVVSNPYYQEISQGNVPTHVAIHVISSVASAGDARMDMSELGIATIPVLSSAELLKIVSAHTNDSSGGTGAIQVEVHGLDANYDQIEELVTMTGTTIATTVNTYFRINDFHVMSVGAGGVAAGNITLSDSGGTTYSQISINENNALQTFYTIPRSMSGLIVSFGGGGITGNVTTKGRIRLTTTGDPSSRSVNTGVFYTERIIEFQNGQTHTEVRLPILVPPKGSLKTTINRQEGASSVSGNSHVDFYIEASG